MTVRHFAGRVWAAAVLALVSCTKTLPTTPPPVIEYVVSGYVTDANGRPVSSATVEVVGHGETKTDAIGEFELAVEQDGRYIINIRHADYADISYVSQRPFQDFTWCLVRAQIETVDPSAPIMLTDVRSELGPRLGATIRVPANCLVDRDGKAAEGLVRAAIATLDVESSQAPGDWAVRAPDGTDGFLISYGTVFVRFTDPDGLVEYQICKGKTADIDLPVTPRMRQWAFKTPDATFWYYDDRDGYWKENGKAKHDPDRGSYVGQIDHLSTINTDIAKFDNAACLAITRDASVPLNSRLRIRYHSGGTAFGQTPIVVLDQTLNAAFRLPANTNVLLELFDASDQPYEHFVVEDPAGTPTINNVINTGPALPTGSDLFPPHPFSTCKPITLKIVDPEVEIQINALTSDAERDNPTDDYITWAPTFCRARLKATMPSAVSVVLTNDPATDFPDGGNVRFAAFASPWPYRTTATDTNLPLTLPADGSWVPFVIAGEYRSPSDNDKDTIIEAHQGDESGAIIGTKALMVRVRKNANGMEDPERDRFLFAMQKLRTDGAQLYLMFQELHRLASTPAVGDEAHDQPAFYPWHRAMLLHVERELQKIDPSVAIPYWDWDSAAPNVFHRDFMGAPDTSGSGLVLPIFTDTNPLHGWDTDLGFQSGGLRRDNNDHTAAPASSYFRPLDDDVDPDLVQFTDYSESNIADGFYTSFSTSGEKLSHDSGHTWPCATGHVQKPMRSAADPLFYLLHSQVDRQWAYWQWYRNRFGVVSGGSLTFPSPPVHYDNQGNWNSPGAVTDPDDRQKGSYLDDGMWPWDGTTGGTAGSVEERPINQAPSPPATENVTQSLPAVPQAPFPQSSVRHLWPAAPVAARPRDMIDYLGFFRSEDGLGFCYEDVPYGVR